MKEKEKIKNKMKDMIKKLKLSKSQIMLTIIFSIITVVLSLGTSYAATTIFSSSDVGFDNTGTKIQATTVQGAIDELYDAATDYSSMNTRVTALEDYKNQIYPIGSIYIGVNNTNPSTLFGGTWESFGEGRTLIGVGTGTDSNSTQKVFLGNETGGEYNHTLTINEMPSHKHEIAESRSSSNTGYIGAGQHPQSIQVRTDKNGLSETSGVFNDRADGTYFDSHFINTKGGSQPHNNIQPYITVYMWKRTA